MNNLSKECIEQIKKKEDLYFKKKSHGWAPHHYAYYKQKSTSYKEGMIEALTNPTIYQSAGLIDIREMEYFMDWKENEFGYDADYTTEQLLTIFRNQNL